MSFENEYRERGPGSGVAYLFGTWSGRIILINAIVYVLMGLQGGWLMPDNDLLLRFGAKDSVSLANGEIWRFVTPIFVHIGLLHFVVNNLGLYFIGYPLERLVGWKWFLTIYLVSGITGNVASALFTMAMSAGASGALFGLLGCGYFLERIIGQKISAATGTKPRSGAYSSMVVVNLIFGAVVPGIDNAAHLGGLIAGIVLTNIMTLARPNQLRESNPFRAKVWSLSLAVVLAVGAILATYPRFVLYRLESQAKSALENFEKKGSRSDGAQAYFFYTEALKIDPDNLESLFQRGRLLYWGGKINEALESLRLPSEDAAYHERVAGLAKEFKTMGFETWQLERLISHTAPNK